MMLNFERRLVWRWALKDKPKNEGQINIRIKSKDEVTAYFGQIDPVLQAWLSGLRSSILTAARRARAGHKRRDFSNMLPLVNWALQLMKDRNLAARKTDKDGGFAVIERHTYHPSMKQFEAKNGIKKYLAKASKKTKSAASQTASRSTSKSWKSSLGSPRPSASLCGRLGHP